MTTRNRNRPHHVVLQYYGGVSLSTVATTYPEFLANGCMRFATANDPEVDFIVNPMNAVFMQVSPCTCAEELHDEAMQFLKDIVDGKGSHVKPSGSDGASD